MDEFRFVNAGCDVSEPKGLWFNRAIPQHAFFYFQGPATVGGKRVDSGACILYTGGTAHDYATLDGFVNSYIGFFVPDDILTGLGIKTNKVIYPANCSEINDILREICDENGSRHQGYETAILSLILKMLVTIARGTGVKRDSTEFDRLRDKMTALRGRYLANVAEPPKIDAIIRESGLSRTWFYRMYSSIFHMSPKEDLIWARLKRARNLILENPDRKLYDVAVDCGFIDMPHFSHIFKNRYGYTPKAYAEAVKNSRA